MGEKQLWWLVIDDDGALEGCRGSSCKGYGILGYWLRKGYRPYGVRRTCVGTLRCSYGTGADLVSCVAFPPAVKYDIILPVTYQDVLKLRTQSVKSKRRSFRDTGGYL